MKNWERERWRKIYLRESAEQAALWPLMQRGMQAYCIKVVDDDGTLVRVPAGKDPIELVARVLRAADHEREWAMKAVEELLADGFLAFDGVRVFVSNLPAAQGDDWVEEELREPETPLVSVPAGPLSPAERSRRYRTEQRRKRHADRDGSPLDASRNTVTNRHEASRDAPSRNTVTVSRGDSQNDASEGLLDSQKGQTNQPDTVTGARDADGHSSRDGDTVTAVTRVTTRRDSKALAEAALRDPQMASLQMPLVENWPEVKEVCSAFAETYGRQDKPRHQGDPRAKAILGRLAEGISVAQLVAAVRGSKFASYIAENQANQALVTILRDGAQVDKFAALKGPQVRAAGSRVPAPRQPSRGYDPTALAEKL